MNRKLNLGTAGAIFLLGLAGIWLVPGGMQGQEAAPARGLAKRAAKEAAESEDPAERLFPDGAPLKTEPELQRLLGRADQFIAEQRYDLAAVLWQKVLDEAGDALMTSDGGRYTSLGEQVEMMMAKLPAVALKTYRITADGEAQGVLAEATPETEEQALAKVVQRFFLSSIGDEAAYKLACLALDRHDFVGASRLLNKIVKRFPDPSIPQGDLLLRLAVANARLGDKRGAEKALEQLNSLGVKPRLSLLELVQEDVQQSLAVSATGQGIPAEWKMPLGNASRTGRMKSLPSAATSRTLAEMWIDEFEMSYDPGPPSNHGGAVFLGGGMMMRTGRVINQPAAAVSATREQVVSQWKLNGWFPTSQLYFEDDRVFVKTHDHLVCYSTKGDGQLLWKVAWRNRYAMDGISQARQMFLQSGMAQPDTARPRTPAEVLLFGDIVHQSVSVSDGVIYSIEGQKLSASGSATSPVSAQVRNFNYQTTPRRTRQNWLAAYDSHTGKIRWHRPAMDDGKEEGGTDVGFLAAPTPFENLLLVPVTDGGTVWLYALARDGEGKTVWKSYLCDEPLGGCSPWSPVAVSVAGRDAYVTCGAGVVFSLDASSGLIHWAQRYRRDSRGKNPAMQQYGGYGIQNLQDFNGWLEDAVVAWGKAVMVMSSDCDRILALDRRSGDLLWESPRTSFGKSAQYCLGVSGRRLVVAGRDVARGYDIPSGRLVWEKEFEPSFGRGCVTDDIAYIPVRDSILKLDVENGKDVGQVGVRLTSADPVGNLFSDGEKLWIAGGARVYTVTNLEHRLEILSEQVAKGDIAAQLNRMRLYGRNGQTQEAVEDLLAAYDKTRRAKSFDDAADVLFSGFNDLQLVEKSPQRALDIILDAFVASNPPPLAADRHNRRRDIVRDLLQVVRKQKPEGMVKPLLASAPLLDQDFLIAHAGRALAAVATKEDAPLLIAAAGEAGAERQLMLPDTLVKILGAEAKETLKTLAAASDDRVKLSAARALLNLEDRSALNVLSGLLASENSRVRSRSNQALRFATGQTINFLVDGTPQQRKEGIDAWKAWIDKDGSAAKLKLPLPETDAPLGRLLIAYYQQARVVELDEQKQERWTKNVQRPWGCHGLPNGNRVIACYDRNMVVEYDAEGREVWQKAGLPGNPFGVQRLENGNTLCACSDSQKVVEIASDGSTAWSIDIPGRPMGAQRLENGNTLIALSEQRKVVEVDRDKKIVWESRNLEGPIKAYRLENGNTLVVQMYNGEVAEIDHQGKKVWFKNQLQSPYDAQRLPNGHTVIADNTGVHEVDAKGSVIWKRAGQGASGLSYY
jgi:outer membrane protein assembly factor BamB